jgi:hypothetical protein
MNKHTIRNANLLSNYKKFSEKFAEMTVSSLLNLFSDYDQIELHLNFQNMMTFMTSLELLCQTTLSMSMTNLSAQFSQEIIQMLNFNISHDIEVFIDNIEVKKSKMKYDNEESFSEVHCFIFEHLQTLNHILLTLKLTNVKVFREKSHFRQSEIVIVEYSCDYEKKHLKVTKIVKIVN